MQTHWFVQQSGKIYGPFDSPRLKKLVAAGKISADSGVAKDKAGPWTQASRVRGLFPESGSSAADAAATLDEEKPLATIQKRRTWIGGSRTQGEQLATDTGPQPMWYFRDDDRTATGPFTQSDIEKLVDRGVIRPSTFVLKHGTVRWETAFSAGLFLDDPAGDSSSSGTSGEGSIALSGSAGPEAKPVEQVLWRGRASHHVNYGTYVLCALGAPLFYPARWGLRRFLERNSIQYVITSEKVQVESGVGQKQKTEIPLSQIQRVELETPSALEGTRACNISLFDGGGSLLTIFEGIPLDEAAQVISLCESALHHQLKVDASARVLAHQRVEEERALRRLAAQRQHALRSATIRAGKAELRATEAEQQARRLKTILGDDCPDDVIERSLAAFKACPPYQPRRQAQRSGLFGWFGGRREQTTWVRGFYRNGKWVKPYKRTK